MQFNFLFNQQNEHFILKDVNFNEFIIIALMVIIVILLIIVIIVIINANITITITISIIITITIMIFIRIFKFNPMFFIYQHVLNLIICSNLSIHQYYH